MSPDLCPHCGAEVPSGAKACPECGSDEQTGWSEQAHYDRLDLPDDKFDYGDFINRELSKEKSLPRGIHWFWWLMAILVVAILIGLWVR